MKEQKKCIVTAISGEKYGKIWEVAEPYFVDYAERCGAELIVLQGGDNLPSPHWIKFALYDLLKKEFSRAVWLDGDILIRSDAPSLFDVVPEDEFGIFNEGYYTPRSICLHEVKKVYDVNLPNWNGKDYYNTGVMVVSRKHRHIFKVQDEIKPLRNSFGEQTYLNMRLMQSGEKVHLLNHRYNRMCLMDRYLGMTRLDSFIVHYAGLEVISKQTILEAMLRDIDEWKKNPEYKYKRQIFIWSFGGAGDIVTAEPTVRYIREKAYHDADIYIMTKDPELYDHIKDVEISETYPDKSFDAVLEFNTHYVNHGQFHSFVPHSQVHPVDWISQAILGRTLDMKDREIKLTYNAEHLERVREFSVLPEIIIHPGKGWETKTFPKWWWDEVISGLKGYRVGIIGKHVNDEHGYVDVDVPDGVTDYRDKLSMKELIALIANVPILITNDSLPLHIAGAFDNYIVLIPTCKRADCLLPYRKGSMYHKAISICKKTIDDDNPYVPTSEVGWKVGGWQIGKFRDGHKIEEYLPETKEVIEAAIKFIGQATKVTSPRKDEKDDEAVFSSRSKFIGVEPYRRTIGHAVFRDKLYYEPRRKNGNGGQRSEARP